LTLQKTEPRLFLTQLAAQNWQILYLKLIFAQAIQGSDVGVASAGGVIKSFIINWYSIITIFNLF
ncbi:MAG: hypothetical protein AAF410_02330, partial [Pseudomonadota bacterium]